MNDLMDLSANAMGPAWPSTVLALALLGDALISLKPPAFVRDCLLGVRLPQEWWWVLIVVKLLAAAGLLLGPTYPGIGLAAAVGAVSYFICAVFAHIRARFLTSSFWLNCLGMLALSALVLAVSYGPLLGNS